MKIETHLDHQTILANQARPVFFAVRISADSLAQPRPRPAAFCLVLDRSGSMAGAPLAHAKQAAALAVKHLRAGDQFSLVTFESEAQVVASLFDLMKGRTTLMVAHRLTTIRRVDKILVLEAGRLTGCGRPAELAQQPGYYARVTGGQAALD